MPLRIANNSVMVHREGKTHRVPVGKPFEFTPEEIKELEVSLPGSLRKPVNETHGAPVRELPTTGPGAAMSAVEVTDTPKPLASSEVTSPRRSGLKPRASAPNADDDTL